MEATKVDEALRRATKEFGLCPNRVWAIGHNLEGWETKLPHLIPTSERMASMGVINHEGHEQCTFDLCEYSMLNFTSVAQRHEWAHCLEKPCSTLKELFPRNKLDEASLAGRPTAWKLDGQSLVNVAEPYMAISHVWADGTGVGVSPDGEVNECLYRFFERIARRWHCEGIWWDTICIPKDKTARAKAINRMESNYESARITLVHDGYIRKWKWVDAETACLAIILSPWFSRGWTALELARSSKVKVIFKGSVIKDLDEDILSKSDSDTPCHRFATEAIKGLRKKRVENLNDLLTVLGPRSTSWGRDMAVISSLLVGIQKSSGEKQQDIYQQVLRKFGWVAHGHLFHRSATMTGHFSWCPTNLLALPMACITQERLEIDYNGVIRGSWKVIKPNSVPGERYVLHSGFPLVDIKVKVALEAADQYVLLGEPDAVPLTRAIAAKILSTSRHLYEFTGPVYFNPPLAREEIQWKTVHNVTITDSHKKRGFNKGERPTPALASLPAGPGPLKSMSPTKEMRNSSMDKEHRLVLAAMEGDYDEINKILKDKVNVDSKDSGGWTALHHAVRRGHHKIVSELLRKAADVTIQDELGQQGLHLAAERGDDKLLIDNKRLMIGHQPCKDGQTALHRAVLAGSPVVVTMLLDRFPDIIDAQDSEGRTALHLCAELGLCEIFTLLLSRQANPMLKDSTRRTTLHYAAMDWNDIPDMISALLDYEGLNVPDDDGRMPLHYAAGAGCLRYIKLLSQSTHLAAVDSRGETALHVAAHGGHLQAAKELLACNVQRQELTQAIMDAALNLAASVGNLQIVQALVDHGAGIWHRDSSGRTAVETAVEQKRASLIMYLTELALSSSRAKDLPPGWIQVARTCPLNDDASALHHAISRNYQNVAVALVEDGKNKATMDAALHLAASLNNLQIAQALVDHGADIWHRDSSGRTAVETAVEQKRAPIIMYLAELALSSSRAKDLPPGWIQVTRTSPLNGYASAIHHAISRDYRNVAVALIEDGENIYAIGGTLLSLAVGKVAKSVVRALVQKYAHAIWEAKMVEKGIRVYCAKEGMPLDIFRLTKIQPYEGVLSDCRRAVMYLEEAFNSTNDAEMRRLLTPAWETMDWKCSGSMALGMELTPSTLHGTVIDSSDSASTQLRELSSIGSGLTELRELGSFGSHLIGPRRHTRRGKSKYSRLAERRRHPFDDEDEIDDDETDDGDDDEESELESS
ncbi:hypothetical protein BBP40_009295 [Aspergillus hancockii]|nr:hypothetical protein BBP40_009295 [Aspergillus hancockii]